MRRISALFDRIPVDQNSRIQSTCTQCGFVITASVTEGLQDRELDHEKECLRRKSSLKAKAS